MERTETQQAERAPASTTGQAAAANNCSCNCDYGCDCDCDYGCGCCCGCERAPTGLSIYQQARRMLMPDGEQGPSYRNAAQDQNQRRAPAEREPASIWQAASADQRTRVPDAMRITPGWRTSNKRWWRTSSRGRNKPKKRLSLSTGREEKQQKKSPKD